MDTISVSSDHFIYAMSGENAPALHAGPGARLAFATCDCFHGQIRSESQSIDALDWEHVNPATGPVYIEGAMPGDALRVAVERIDFTGDGIMAAIPDAGIFGHEVKSSTIRMMKVEGEHVVFAPGIRLPVRPMIGVVGTAPAGAPVPCGTPGSHGGNMDCAKIAPGSTLYLPVFHPGGLLAMGDVHACMGDGEVMGTGVEIPALVLVTVGLEKNWPIADPVVVADGMFYAVCSDDTLERAATRAAGHIRRLVEEKRGMDRHTAGMLLSAAGSVEVCQMVDPQVTVRFGLPGHLLG